VVEKTCDRINESDALECWRMYFQPLNCILFFLNLLYSVRWKSICLCEEILQSLFSNTLWLVCVSQVYAPLCQTNTCHPLQTPFLPVVSSHKISNLYFPQIFSLVFSLQMSLLFPLTSHLDKLLSATSYQNVLEGWLMWEETSPGNPNGSKPHISILI
jgi:hypothetical protein